MDVGAIGERAEIGDDLQEARDGDLDTRGVIVGSLARATSSGYRPRPRPIGDDPRLAPRVVVPAHRRSNDAPALPRSH
jgi:hypothetical protein